jgi:dolichyl-phosphate beta-glucosyltransferase
LSSDSPPPLTEPAQPDVCIVVPCYDEAERLPVDRFRQFIDTQPGYRFLFVDDGSRDGTAALLRSLCAERPDRFDMRQLDRNRGKAEAVRCGFMATFETGADFIGFWDADLATPLDVLPAFLSEFDRQRQLEMVFGSRVKMLGRDVQRTVPRHYFGRLLATAASIVLGLPIYDTQCGAKLFRVTDTLHAIFKEPFRTSWVFDVELIARFMQLRERSEIKEVGGVIYELALPQWHHIEGSKIKLHDSVGALIDLLRIYWMYR